MKSDCHDKLKLFSIRASWVVKKSFSSCWRKRSSCWVWKSSSCLQWTRNNANQLIFNSMKLEAHGWSYRSFTTEHFTNLNCFRKSIKNSNCTRANPINLAAMKLKFTKSSKGRWKFKASTSTYGSRVHCVVYMEPLSEKENEFVQH